MMASSQQDDMASNRPLNNSALQYVPYNQHILVTGGTAGIGKATVLELATIGASVFTCARRHPELQALLDTCKAQNLNVTGVVADVSTAEGREALIAAVEPWCGGRLDGLINNVGTNLRKPTVEYSEEDFQQLVNTNVLSAFSLSRDCHRLLKRTEGTSCILFNSSVAGGPTALKSGSIYALTKAALNQLAKNLTCEWSKDGIRVISVAPWYTATPLANQVLEDERFKAEVINRTPMRRIAQPEEVAKVMTFLCSPAASYVTGVTLPVDGGYSCMGLF